MVAAVAHIVVQVAAHAAQLLAFIPADVFPPPMG
jgi:hypothetical protein